MTDIQLAEAACAAMKRAYAPYSRFLVGAALLCADGSVYTGCNVENSSYGATCCAERTAVFKAVSDGKRSFSAIAVVGGADGKINGFCPPCGICRQVLSEFAAEGCRVILYDGEKTKSASFDEFLPHSFTKDNLG
jgi:cytidine deaminase